MPVNLDNYFGMHAKSLSLKEKRASQLADNIANANTPNYKAKDFDFQKTLQGAMALDSNSMKATQASHLGGSSTTSLNMQYRIPHHLTHDGNTVDKEAETAEFAKNALSYQTSLTFLDGKIKSMLMALRGE